MLQNNIFVFNVDPKLTKLKLKLIIQEIFNVDIVSINTYLLPGKTRRLGKFRGLKNSYKRVFIKIKGEKTIPFFSSF